MDGSPPSLTSLRGLLPGARIADRWWAEPRLTQAEARLGRGQPAERLLTEIHGRLSASVAEVARRGALPLTISYPEQLPVAQRRDDILAALRAHPVLVLTGETGSGKTTQLPKLLLEAGCGRRGMIAMTQPRRVAALAMAARIREECRAGDSVVAHSVRFDDRATPDTLVRVMTDGLLLAEATNDPDFLRYDAVVIDEAHERSLNIDLLLGLLKLLRQRRPELMIVISSASIAAERFADYFGSADKPAPIVAVSGRTFPVEIRHQLPGDDDIGYLGAALSAIRELCDAGERGDILCFLPTERDIIEARRRLDDLAGTLVLPLFGRLTPAEQQRVFAPARGRKVVLATNLAETSLTIPGIRFVVDTGLARFKRYQAASRTERLPIEAVSQASCIQRAGRAGRVEAGICIRLFPAEDFLAREPFTSPEILRSNLAGVLLQCLSFGLGDPVDFPWLDAPSTHAWVQARGLLDELGAMKELSETRATVPELSPLGRRLAAIPADPQVARILLAGHDEGVPHEACTIAAFLSVQDPRVRPVGQEAKADAGHRRFVHEAGDLATILNLWDAYQEAPSNSARSRLCDAHFLGYRRMREWADVRHQLWQAVREGRSGKPVPSAGHAAGEWPLDRVHRAVLAGMLGNVLMYDPTERCYRAAGDRQLHVHPGSALRAGKAEGGRPEPGSKRAAPPPPWLVACEVVETSRLFARLCAPIDPLWVIELAGERVKRRHRQPHYHAARRQVVCIETVTWKGLPLRDGRMVPYERIDARDATTIFVREALAGETITGGVPWIEGNRAVVDEARRLRDRLRDATLTIDEHVLEPFYRERLGLDGPQPPLMASTDALRRWCATHGEQRLCLALSDLAPDGVAERAQRDFPEHVDMGGQRLALRYRFLPGDADDGATLELSEDQLALIDVTRLDWLVPGWVTEMTEAYLQQLPKDLRRRLIPLAESARTFCIELMPVAGRRLLAEALADVVRTRLGQAVPAFDQGSLSPHLRLRFHIRSTGGATVYAGRDPGFLGAQASAAGDRLRLLRDEWETVPAASWPGDCPGAVTKHGIAGHVALARDRDAQGKVAARRTVFASEIAAQAWHDDGLEALVEAALDDELTALALAPASAALAARVERICAQRLGALRRQLALAAANADLGRVRDERAFIAFLASARQALASAAPVIDGMIERVTSRVETLRNRLKQGAKSLASATVARGVADHLSLLIAPGWPAQLPWTGLRRLDAFLDGLIRRLDGATTKPQEALRMGERCNALLGRWAEAFPDDDRRLVQALGLARSVRDLAAVREECLLGLVVSGSGAAGFAEGKLLSGLADMGRRVAAERVLSQSLRERARDLRAALARLPPGTKRDGYEHEGERLLAAFPELGLGADLLAQRQRLDAWCERVRLGLGMTR